jgi:pseudomonalisin
MLGARFIKCGYPWCLAALALLAPGGVFAAGPVVRITATVDESQRVELKGQLAPQLRASTDLGAADPALPAQRIIMVLGSSAAQEADLTRFLRDAQTRGRPDYHHWLTPEAFGQRYGVAASDLAAVRNWLAFRGFEVEKQSPGRRSIVFSGTVARLNDAFGARMHYYRWHGERHLANSVNPTIPAALAPVVRGFASLNDFRLKPQFHRDRVRPQANVNNGAHAIGPGDFAVIYDLTSSYAQGLTGSGRSIAVIGESSVKSADISNFRSTFGLPASQPTIVLAGSTPGYVSGDETESDLDLEWAGGVAPAVSLQFVTAASTSTTQGVVLSAEFAVQQNLADAISFSYSGCEAQNDAISGGNTYWNQLWQQAAAQGISVFVSSGDSGAANCDAPSSSSATQGLGVNALCSSPYATCVGGTEFVADVSSPSTYWSANNGANAVSALQYIGEAVWNQSGTVSGGSDLWASGGGTSIYYAKPAWQLSTGVPSDGWRDVPDVALNASSAHDPYLIYSSDNTSDSSELEEIGGTSCATPSMAAIAALVMQQQGGRVGSFNPPLYGLSQLQGAGGATVFHTITSGNNSVPGQSGFSASTTDPTYSQASGLGSIDGGMLLAHWGDFAGTVMGLSPATVVVPPAQSVGSATLLLPASTRWSAAISGGGWLTLSPASGTGSAPLTFGTTANTAGAARTATITIDGQVLSITQSAASGVGQLSVSAANLSFGQDDVGSTTASQQLLVSNTGGASLTLGNIGVSGSASGDYTDLGSCATGLVLAPGASCYLNVSFDPTTTGSRSATLQIGGTSVALTGTGEPAVTGPISDGPLPPWSYALLGMLLMATGALWQRSRPAISRR